MELRKIVQRIFFFSTLSLIPFFGKAEDGYRLWLRYDLIKNQSILLQYREHLSFITIEGSSETLNVAADELQKGISGLTGASLTNSHSDNTGEIIIGTPKNSKFIQSLNLDEELKSLGKEGYLIKSFYTGEKKRIIIIGNEDIGVLYGSFHFLKLLQTHQSILNLRISSSPKINIRILNHWDNLDRTVERGYAGFSLWDWHKLPDYIDQRYIDYARANASIGINGTVLTNVNANALVLTKPYLEKVAALANAFRPYGLKVYLTARFSAPRDIGGLKTADPFDPEVQQWWKDKTAEIYSYVPDFGGYLVKANSEGQPGPQNYGRNHADGANILADAVAPFGGIVMWRAFVYDNEVPVDRAKQAYNEFKPLDGNFRKNVMVQVKNGPIDFQPREPFHPLFGAMKATPLMMEFQITQEYLGQGTHLAYLAPMFKEVLNSDTFVKGKGSTVARIVNGSLENHSIRGIAGVANIGNDRNWTSHHFGQSNWYSFGKLAWDNTLTSEDIADEWIRMTFSNDQKVVSPIKDIMAISHEAIVNYMTPLGLHHIMAWDHHFGPGPWIKDKHRADWTSVYYHKASKEGIGFNRTGTGSNALEQYAPEVRKQFENIKDCPEKYLLWFHHVKWSHKLKSGRSLWEEMCFKYNQGVEEVKLMKETWKNLEKDIDPERYKHVETFLSIQVKEAVWWRDACLQYFQTFSGKPIPKGIDKPLYSLDYYQSLEHKFVPGI
jgi:alpha-glucuronidase